MADSTFATQAMSAGVLMESEGLETAGSTTEGRRAEVPMRVVASVRMRRANPERRSTIGGRHHSSRRIGYQLGLTFRNSDTRSQIPSVTDAIVELGRPHRYIVMRAACPIP